MNRSADRPAGSSPLRWTRLDPISWPPASLSPTGRRSGPTTPWSVSTRRSDVAPMSWASSLTDQPCVAWLAPSSLNSTTNGPSAVDTSHPPFSPSMKLLQRPNPQKRLRLRQHQQDDAPLHHLTGRDLFPGGFLFPKPLSQIQRSAL